MDWWAQKLFLYCERGADQSFWAEPFNALSNAAFGIAAVAAYITLRQSRPIGATRAERGLIAMAAAVGVASFLFHTTGARWALALDTGSIAVLSCSVLAYAMRRFLFCRPWATAGALLLLAASFALVRFLPCPTDILPASIAAGRPCLNGSLGYLPVVLALAGMSLILYWREHPAARALAAAAAVFSLSLALRTLDTDLCAETSLWGRLRGTHAAWHILNAITIYLLLRAAIRHGQGGNVRGRSS